MGFRIGGIPVRVDPTFFIVAALLGLSRRGDYGLWAQWIGVVFVSVLLHELGHAFAFRRFGHASAITLHGMGGDTRSLGGPPFEGLAGVWVSLAGPAVGFVVAGVALGARRWGGFGGPLMDDVLWANGYWGLLNLLPILPLDGGHALVSGLGHAFGPRGEKWGERISLGTAVAAAGAAWSLGQTYITFLLLWLGVGQLQARARSRAGDSTESLLYEADLALARGMGSHLAELAARLEQRRGVRPEAVVELHLWAHVLRRTSDERAIRQHLGRARSTDPYLEGLAELAQGQLERALPKLELAYERRKDARRLGALAVAKVRAQYYDQAFELMRSGGALGPAQAPVIVVEAALFEAGRYEQALELSRLRFAERRDPEAAYNAACSLVKLGRREEALEWLERAVESGYRDAAHLDGDEDLAPLRTSPKFTLLRERLRALPSG